MRCMAIAVAVRWREIQLETWLLLAIAGAISVVAMAPFLFPYLQVDRESRPGAIDVSVVTQYNAGWRDYLVTGGRLHYAWWSHRVLRRPHRALSRRHGDRSGRDRHLLVAADATADPRVTHGARDRSCSAVAFSFGTSLPGIRAAASIRCRSSTACATWRGGAGWRSPRISILAGFGVAALERTQWRSLAMRSPWRWACWSTIEAIRTPVGFTRFDGIPHFYDRLAGESVADRSPSFRSTRGANVSLNGPYVLANTRYFKPLLNGYSSFHPESFEARAARSIPFPASRRSPSCGSPTSRT